MTAGTGFARLPCLCMMMLAASVLAADAEDVDLEPLSGLAETLCARSDEDADAMMDIVDGKIVDEKLLGPHSPPMRIERRFRRSGKDEIRLIMDRPGGRLHRLVLELYSGVEGDAQPTAMMLLSGDCQLQHARQILYDDQGHASELHFLDGNLEPLGEPEPLNPPMPPRGPQVPEGAIVVALFDSGLAYTLPDVAARLAYTPDGQPFGYDFWDMDDRPFDADTSRSPFYPIRHGTLVASVLLREAPEALVAPFRYPRPDMSRMADMVEAAAAAGARIVTVPMGSNRQEDWEAFVRAAEDHPELLFVLSAGNDGRDLDQQPLWPASLGLDNALVVTSVEETGHLARGSNWGGSTVDLMVPAENVEVFDYRGVKGYAAGTSYAVPRVAALAARLLNAAPGWSTADLKAAILERAIIPPEGEGLVRYGFIPNPNADE